MFGPIFFTCSKVVETTDFQKSGLPEQPLFTKKTLRHARPGVRPPDGGRGLEYAPPWGSVARPGVSASGAVRVKVSMKWRFLDELKPRPTATARRWGS